MSENKNILGKDIPLPPGVSTTEVSDGDHTFGELYHHRTMNFLALMRLAHLMNLDCGWSRRHSDGERCFGSGCWVIAWITAPSGKQARYHMLLSTWLPVDLEKDLGSEWNGKEETLDALSEIANMLF